MRQDLLANKLRTLRKERELSQMDVAVAVGVGRSTLASIERGHDVPGRETLVALASFYGVGLDWLMSTPGTAIVPGVTVIQTPEEALWLGAYRQLPPAEAEAHLQLVLKRVGTKPN